MLNKKMKNNPFLGREYYGTILKEILKVEKDATLIEVGAQDEVLRPHIPKNISYSSLDVEGNPDYKIDLNSQKIPVADKTFDILVCLGTLEHLFYPKEVLREFRRVVKDDGLFILTIPNEYNFWLRANYFFARKLEGTDEPFEVVTKRQHIHLTRVKDALSLFSQHFKVKKIIYSWQSRRATQKVFYYYLDFVIGFLAKIFHGLFTRNVIMIGNKKEWDR